MRAGKGYVFLLTALLFSIGGYGYGQQITLKGIVLDSITKQPLPYATVAVKDNLLGTATNSDGQFILELPKTFSDSILLCSYMGYKTYSTKVSALEAGDTILLVKEPFSLGEVTVTPDSPWDYVRKAMMSIPKNYAEKPYMSRGYYSEYLSENEVYLKYSEAIVESWYPPYGKNDTIRAKVLKARRIDGLGHIKFKRKMIEKNYAKEKKRTERKGEEWEGKDNIDEEIISSTFGGPELILEEDPLRDTASFLNMKNRKYFIYEIAGYTWRYEQQVIIIGFKSKKIYEHQRMTGKVYISLASNAILAIDYNSEVKIPVLIKPVLFLFGIGIKNPQIHVYAQYRPVRGKWYLNDYTINAVFLLIDKKMFGKNEESGFKLHISLVNEKFDFDNVKKIPDNERMKIDKPLYEQVEPDPDFWENYKVARPAGINE